MKLMLQNHKLRENRNNLSGNFPMQYVYQRDQSTLIHKFEFNFRPPSKHRPARATHFFTDVGFEETAKNFENINFQALKDQGMVIGPPAWLFEILLTGGCREGEPRIMQLCTPSSDAPVNCVLTQYWYLATALLDDKVVTWIKAIFVQVSHATCSKFILEKE